MKQKRGDSSSVERPPRLDGAPLDYAPQNELGVVFLFSTLAKRRYGLRIERIQSAFPDCVAYREGERIRIEFEYRSRNFLAHGHDARKCDWIVCWTHDWPAVPSRLRVVELRKEFGLGFNVWVVPIRKEFGNEISTIRYSEAWSVPSQATQGDLVLFYRTKPESAIRDLFRVAGPVKLTTAGWKAGSDWFAPIRRVAKLKAPVHLNELRAHPILTGANFVRAGMRGRYRVTPHWPELFQMILERNPSISQPLARFGPHRLVGS